MAFQPTIVMMPSTMPSYEVKNVNVFFGNQHVPDAQWIGFKDLGEGYGKDMHNVFYMGHKLDQAHAFTFEVVGNTYAKDREHVFQYGRIIEGLKPFGFEPPTQQMNPTPIFPSPFDHGIHIPSYIVKDFHVFFGNQHVPDAQWVGFKDFGQGYGKDMQHVFYMGKIIDGAQPMTFEILTNGYAKDMHNVYQYGRILEGLHSFTFRAP